MANRKRIRNRTWAYEALLARDGPTCHYCEVVLEGRGSREMTIDHVVPRSKGGNDSLDNLVLACASCNTRKGSLSYEEFVASEFVQERRRSIVGEKVRHRHESIKFTRRGNWSCLCGAAGSKADDPKQVECTLERYGAFYRPVA